MGNRNGIQLCQMSPIPKMPSKITDLEELVTMYAWKMFLIGRDKEEKKLHLEDLKLHMNWSRLKTTTSTPEYSDQRSVLRSTDSSQDHSFQTERTTVSSCSTTVSKGFTKGMHLEVAPHHRTMVNENAKFKVIVRMKGGVVVDVTRRDNSSIIIMSIHGSIKQIVASMINKLDSKSITYDSEKSVINWEMEGTWCRMCGVD